MYRAIFTKKSKFFLKKSYKVFYTRGSIIPKIFLNNYIAIYKGNMFKKLYVTKFNIGFKSGEFSFTRKPFYFPTKEKKKNKR